MIGKKIFYYKFEKYFIIYLQKIDFEICSNKGDVMSNKIIN